MRRWEWLRMVSGSVVVYVAMAACASSGGGGGSDTEDPAGVGAGGDKGAAGGGGILGAGGVPNDAAGGAGGGSFFDALTDPVPNANADDHVSGSRLKARRRVGEDGSKEFLGWYDTKRSEECTFAKASDGVDRCLPGNALYSSAGYFVDAGCTQKVALGVVCGTGPKYAYELAGGCSAIGKLYVLGASLSSIYFKSGTTCTMSALPAGNSGFALGAEVPPSSFVAAVVQMDP